MPPLQPGRNAVYHTLNGVFHFAGMALFSAQVIMPAMIAELSDSAFLLALVPLLMWGGMVIPQVFYAKKVEGLAYKKRAIVFCGAVQRACWLIFLVSLFLHWGAPFTLVAFFVVLAVNGLATGLVIPLWTDWYAKTTLESMWGRLLGFRRAGAGLLALGIGPLILWLMGRFPSPGRYQALLGLAVISYAVSFLCLLLVKEEPERGLPHQRDIRWGTYLQELARILFRRRDFRRFMTGTLILSIPMTLTGTFLTKYGLTFPGVEDGITGVFTTIFFPATSVGALFGGFLGDRRGPIVPFRLFPLLLLGASAAAFLSAHPVMISVAFSFFGLAFGTRMVVFLPSLFRFAGPHRRPSYVAVAFTCLGIVNAAVPLLAGMLVDLDYITFRHIFFLCGVLSVAGWLLFLTIRLPERVPA